MSQFVQGFSNTQEVSVERLVVHGTFPAWLSGTLVRNGPGQFDLNAQSYRHWFDGLAMLHAFTFGGGVVRYAGRYLDTPSYRDDRANGKVTYRGFATDPCRSIFRRVMTLFDPGSEKNGLNTNVNVTRLADSFIAMTETPMAVEFDLATLETLHTFRYEDGKDGTPRLEGQVTTAHPHYDFGRKLGYNYLLKLGASCVYHVHSLDGKARRLVASIPTPAPAYMHSFGMTDNYLILAEFSLVLPSPVAIIMSGKPFIENYRWKPDHPARFHIIDKATGALRTTVETDAFFAFHHVNAFERGDEIVLDVSAYPDSRLIDQLMLDHLRVDGGIDVGHIRRYRLPLNGGRAGFETLSDQPLELPRIHYSAHNGKPYRFVYGVGTKPHDRDFLNRLVKLDTETGAVAIWDAPACYPSEPVFVAAPGASAEDAGVVLSVVLDAARGTSFLLALDGQTFSEIARAELPLAVPFGFHGAFFNG
jgi:carotenoid cleavage dioxygenase-like enzyme